MTLSLLSLLFCSTMAQSAQDIDGTGLTEVQRLELATTAAKLKAQNVERAIKSPDQAAVALSAEVREQVSKWGVLGRGVTSALIAAAKEAGIAIDQFAHTDVGKKATAVILLKMVGKDVAGIIIGTFILLVGFSASLFFLVTSRFHKVNSERVPVLWGLFYVTRVSSLEADIDDDMCGPLLISGIIFVATLVVSLNCIF